MTIEQAIKKAIEGGFTYKAEGWNLDAAIPITMLDPSFWQSLGQAMGWIAINRHEHEMGQECNGFCILDEKQEGWKNRWHRFIDHLAKGKSAESFFETI
jgi:hypothetical protein